MTGGSLPLDSDTHRCRVEWLMTGAVCPWIVTHIGQGGMVDDGEAESAPADHSDTFT